MRRKSFVEKGIRCRRPKNEAEGAFFDYIRKEGWTCTKRGMPDFVCYKDGKMILVEVKPDNQRQPTSEQQRLMDYLARSGIDCFVWSPDDEKLRRVRGLGVL